MFLLTLQILKWLVHLFRIASLAADLGDKTSKASCLRSWVLQCVYFHEVSLIDDIKIFLFTWNACTSSAVLLLQLKDWDSSQWLRLQEYLCLRLHFVSRIWLALDGMAILFLRLEVKCRSKISERTLLPLIVWLVLAITVIPQLLFR